MKLLLSVPVALAALLWPLEADAQVDPARAVRNYQAVQRGERRLADLTPVERLEVAEVDRLVNAPPTDRLSAAERCRRAQNPGGAEPSELERRIIDLKCSQR